MNFLRSLELLKMSSEIVWKVFRYDWVLYEKQYISQTGNSWGVDSFKQRNHSLIGILQQLVMWSTFCKHENSSLLEKFLNRNWKSKLKLSNLWIFSRISQKERLQWPSKIRRICLRKTTLATQSHLNGFHTNHCKFQHF